MQIYNIEMTDKRQITPHKGGRTDRLFVRIRPEVKAALFEIAEKTGQSVADIIEQFAMQAKEQNKSSV